jgi:hypothetical protein
MITFNNYEELIVTYVNNGVECILRTVMLD